MANYLYRYKFQDNGIYIGRDKADEGPYKRAKDHLQGALHTAYPEHFFNIFYQKDSELYKITKLHEQSVDKHGGTKYIAKYNYETFEEKFIKKYNFKKQVEQLQFLRTVTRETDKFRIDRSISFKDSNIEENVYKGILKQKIDTEKSHKTLLKKDIGLKEGSYVETSRSLKEGFNFYYPQEGTNKQLYNLVDLIRTNAKTSGFKDDTNIIEYLLTANAFNRAKEFKSILNRELGDYSKGYNDAVKKQEAERFISKAEITQSLKKDLFRILSLETKKIEMEKPIKNIFDVGCDVILNKNFNNLGEKGKTQDMLTNCFKTVLITNNVMAEQTNPLEEARFDEWIEESNKKIEGRK